ncbi:hypothetical protein BRYFOR_05125 [Marvinbryantia formatexigens DSM 14469]|uniref:SipW-cognate class signal peptide n=2 Tax=Marvinbryantia TaxID=248744 RepID=C6L936_9FIRM|nr:hypothetical protein BRYFOR_05125 [Marvinbryantia formatexigens DSM 14469]
MKCVILQEKSMESSFPYQFPANPPEAQRNVKIKTERNVSRKMKNFFIAMLAGALILGVGAGVSFAYLTAQDDAQNSFGVSSVDITIDEEFEPPGEITPGKVITKAPRICSSSDTDCYVRAAVRFTDSDAENCCEALAINPGWQAGEDGYYYWQERLQPGGWTGTLFDKVTIKQNAEEIPPFDILVYAEAVQCGNNTMKEAWEEIA